MNPIVPEKMATPHSPARAASQLDAQQGLPFSDERKPESANATVLLTHVSDPTFSPMPAYRL